jgi:hypothetical protein
MQATNLFARVLLTKRLIPLLRAAASTDSLARVVGVASGTHEGPVDPEDWACMNMSTLQLRGAGATMTSVALLNLAKEAPEVTFINEYPGLVMTGALNVITGVLGVLVRTVAYLFQRWLAVPIEESGERHVFIATSGAYKPKSGNATGLPVVEGLEIHSGTDGQAGSGVYSISWDGEGPSEKVVQLLKRYSEDGMSEKVWTHITGELERILGEPA